MTNGYESSGLVHCQGCTNLHSRLKCLQRTEIDPVLDAFISPWQTWRFIQKPSSKVLQLCKICNKLVRDLISCQRLLQSVICYKRPSFGLHNSSLQGTTMQRSSCFQTLLRSGWDCHLDRLHSYLDWGLDKLKRQEKHTWYVSNPANTLLQPQQKPVPRRTDHWLLLQTETALDEVLSQKKASNCWSQNLHQLTRQTRSASTTGTLHDITQHTCVKGRGNIT